MCWLWKHFLEKWPALEEHLLMSRLVALIPVCDIPPAPAWLPLAHSCSCHEQIFV